MVYNENKSVVTFRLFAIMKDCKIISNFSDSSPKLILYKQTFTFCNTKTGKIFEIK